MSTLDIKSLLPELKKLVSGLSEDMLQRVNSNPEIGDGLKHAWQQIEKGGRTAQAYEVWLEDYLDQVAVAWVLACVFVRFMEDNGLIEECWLAGEGQRRQQAEDAHTLYFRDHPRHSDREYFEHVFREVGKIPAATDLFAQGKTPLWAVGPTGDAARNLLKFWQEQEIDTAKGHLKRSFRVTDSDTRFLGDLYQDLSENAKKKYALLQTPVFVEEFILDRTLTPALDEFGLETVRMIDPTCGSGHFLLGGFARLFNEWSKQESNEIKAAQMALDGVWGVDINPFAVAIARFRLIVAAVQACGIKRLKQAPGWKVHLATGDSLLFGNRWGRSGEKIKEQGWLGTDEESWAPEIYACEDHDAVQEALGQQYDVVVGNPPYITVGDEALNAAYRKRYSTCHRLYSLAVPFTERFFDLCRATTTGQHCGYVGMITANSFMKRIFGKKLIEQYLPTIDLTHVIDTSVAYIPGHTTSTVILLGRNRPPVLNTVRAVLGIKGEEGVPADPANGVVWQSLLRQVDTPNTVSAYCSSSDTPRQTLHKHPWSIGGGGAAELAEGLKEKQAAQLGDLVQEIGFGAVTREDEAYLVGQSVTKRLGIPDGYTRPVVSGDGVRDWAICNPVTSLFPYDPLSLAAKCPPAMEKFLWPLKNQLSIRVAYGMTQLGRGNKWYEYSMLFRERLRAPLSIAFAEIATHAHFVFDKGENVFTQSAPIIKLDAAASEGDHFALLGVLNSSAVCFWAKQVIPCKGLGGQGGGIKPEHWSRQYVHSGTLTKMCPIPPKHSCVTSLAKAIDSCAKDANAFQPRAIVSSGVHSLAERLEKARNRYESLHRKMVSAQEELDWKVYWLFGLCEDTEMASADVEKGICPEDRPVERLLASRMQNGEKSIYYDVHAYRGTGSNPQRLSPDIESTIEKRLRIIANNAEIRLIEQIDFKRRWQVEPWEKQVQTVVRDWLLDRLETPMYRKGTKDHPELTTTAQIADVASADVEFLQVAALYRGRPDFDVAALVAELVEAESVPFLPILRYKPTGLRKRQVWERTWELQRQEDQIALRHERIKEREEALWERLSKSFPEDRKRLELMDSELKAQSIQVKNDFAPEVGFQDGWKGTTMVAELCEQGVRTPRGALALSELITRKDAYRELEAELNRKIQATYVNDSEVQALRAERDAIPNSPDITVPPKYATADFLKTDFWRLRGKLDVPKERWISYPQCQRDGDPSLVVGWAGWNHLLQATALVAYYDARKREGWRRERLTPLLAGLDQLLPWIHQWHPEIDPEYGETAGQSFQTLLESDAHELGLTLEEIRNWTPPEKPRKTRTTRNKQGE